MSNDEQHITEDEWIARFGWSMNDRDDGGLEFVPGITDQALGYYLCDRPRTDDDENIVGIIPPTEEG